jgi:hypothetical protein
MKSIYTYGQLLLFIAILVPGVVNSGDLNDGIGIDEAINDDLKPTVNVPFILMKARAAESRGERGIESSRPVIIQGQGGQGNQTFGIGTKFGAGTTIINASEIKNSTSITNKR